jgi:hypothetical protein
MRCFRRPLQGKQPQPIGVNSEDLHAYYPSKQGDLVGGGDRRRESKSAWIIWIGKLGR